MLVNLRPVLFVFGPSNQYWNVACCFSIVSLSIEKNYFIHIMPNIRVVSNFSSFKHPLISLGITLIKTFVRFKYGLVFSLLGSIFIACYFHLNPVKFMLLINHIVSLVSRIIKLSWKPSQLTYIIVMSQHVMSRDTKGFIEINP